MPRTKIVVETATQDAARSVEGILREILEPAPDAVSVFVIASDADRRTVEAYYDVAPSCAEVDAALAATSKPGIGPARSEDIPDENWVAVSQAALPPVIAGRFIVHGRHDRERVGFGPNAIEIDAGEAFGTAHHATTQGCLMALGPWLVKHHCKRIIDIGCGSGVLALAAARMAPRSEIVASDIDPIAIDVARANAVLNRAGRRIRFVVARGFEHPQLRQKVYDLVIANILARPLIALAKDVRRSAGRRGTVILSGLLTNQATEVLAAYRAHDFVLVRRLDIAGWSTLVLQHRPCRAKLSARRAA